MAIKKQTKILGGAIEINSAHLSAESDGSLSAAPLKTLMDAADASLTTRVAGAESDIDSVIVVHNADEASLNTRVAAEEAARAAADTALEGDIDSLIVVHNADETSLNTRVSDSEDDIDSLIVVHNADETSLNTRVGAAEDDIDSLIVVHNADETSLNTRISDEEISREAAVNNEASLRQLQDAKQESRAVVYDGLDSSDSGVDDPQQISGLGTDLGGADGYYHYKRMIVFLNGIIQTPDDSSESSGALVYANSSALSSYTFASDGTAGDYIVSEDGYIMFNGSLISGASTWIVMWS